MLPFLRIGTIFPILQSRGRMAGDNDCENMTDKNTLEICFVLFSTLELMLSIPAEEDILKFSIMLTILEGDMVMSAIGAQLGV